MTEEEKMLAGEIYDANYDEGLHLPEKPMALPVSGNRGDRGRAVAV